jgi:hypothetical protein
MIKTLINCNGEVIKGINRLYIVVRNKIETWLHKVRRELILLLQLNVHEIGDVPNNVEILNIKYANFLVCESILLHFILLKEAFVRTPLIFAGVFKFTA